MPVSVNCCSMLCDLSFALLTLNTWVLNLAQFISSIMTFTFLLASRFLSRPHVLLTTIFFGHSGFFPILGRLSTEKEHTGSQIDGEEEMIFSTCVCLCIYLSIYQYGLETELGGSGALCLQLQSRPIEGRFKQGFWVEQNRCSSGQISLFS